MNSYFISLFNTNNTDNTFIDYAKSNNIKNNKNVNPVDENWIDMGGFSDGWTDSPYFKNINYSKLFKSPSDESIEIAFLFSSY